MQGIISFFFSFSIANNSLLGGGGGTINEDDFLSTNGLHN